jgi:two-component system, chemotaxis family, sensor kinase CheA
MIPSVDVKEFLDGFLGEAHEHLRGITAQLSTLANSEGQANPRAVRELFRSLHTLKGLAGMMGIEPLVALSHAMESLVRVADRAGGRLPAKSLDPLIRGKQTLEQRVRALAESSPLLPAPDDLLAALEAALPSAGQPVAASGASEVFDSELGTKLSAAEKTEIAQALAGGDTAYAVEFVPSAERAERGLNITSVRERIAQIGRVIRVLPQSVARSEQAPGGLKFVLVVVSSAGAEAVAGAAGAAPAAITALSAPGPAPVAGMPPVEAVDDVLETAQRRGVVRVDVQRLDDTLEHVAALGVNRARLAEAVRQLEACGADVRSLRALLEENVRFLRRMRSSVIALRMVPLREVLEPLPLIVRGLRGTTGKRARLEIDVGETELDKAVAERIFPALVHLVRNAFDHGIEAVEERAARGKPEEGTIFIDARAQSSTDLQISVADDGAGIDAGRVAARAGRETPEDDTRLLDILTIPGFSTRDAVSTTSGRGLGMDIVRQTVERLGGDLGLYNQPGRGARFRLRVPLTVAMIDAIAFEAGEQRFLVPVTSVDEIVEVEAAAVATPPRTAAGVGVDLLERRGESVPLVSLFRLLGMGAPGAQALEPKAIVVRRQGEPYAFGVRRMLGKHEVLVRPLADPLISALGIAGSADLGDGQPTLVVDLLALTAKLSKNSREVRS